MATYNTVMKKRNANNDGWDIVLPVSIAENILVGESQIPLSEYLETKIDKSMIVQNSLSTNPATVASGPALKNVQDQVNTLTNNFASGNFNPFLYGKTVAGTNVYGARYGRYYKINKLIICTMYIAINSKDVIMDGNLYIGGLPFPIKNETNYYPTGEISGLSGIILDSGYTQVGFRGNPGATNGLFIQSGSGKARDALKATSLPAGFSEFFVGLTYETT